MDTKPKRRRNKSAKGGLFERNVARELTKWWTGDPERDVIFWRTAGSGGRATIRGKRNKKTNTAHCGDLAALEPDGEPLTKLITFELKRGYNRPDAHCTVTDLLDKPSNFEHQEGIEEWIEQARTSAANAGTPYWMILHKRDTRDPICLIPSKLFDALDGEDHKFNVPIALFWAWVRLKDGTRKKCTFAIITFASFLDGVSPEEIRSLYAQHLKEKQ